MNLNIENLVSKNLI